LPCAARGLLPASRAAMTATSVTATPFACAARVLLPPLQAGVAATRAAATPSACAARGLLFPLPPPLHTVLSSTGVPAATDAAAAATRVAATPWAFAARGILPPSPQPNLVATSGARAPTASPAVDIVVAIASHAAAPASGVPAAAVFTADIATADAVLARPAVASTVAFPRVTTASVEAVEGDREATVPEALEPEGFGRVLLPYHVSDSVLGTVCHGAYEPGAEAAQSVINPQLHARMLDFGDFAYRDRRHVHLASQGGRVKGAVRHVLEDVASRIGNDLHAAYDGVTPHILIKTPCAPEQLPHKDAGLHAREGSTTYLLSGYVSLAKGTGVEMISNVCGGAGGEGEYTTLPTPVWSNTPEGSCLIVRFDLVHRETSHLRGSRQLQCLHAYLAAAQNVTHMAYAEYMSFAACYF